MGDALLTLVVSNLHQQGVEMQAEAAAAAEEASAQQLQRKARWRRFGNERDHVSNGGGGEG